LSRPARGFPARPVATFPPSRCALGEPYPVALGFVKFVPPLVRLPGCGGRMSRESASPWVSLRRPDLRATRTVSHGVPPCQVRSTGLTVNACPVRAARWAERWSCLARWPDCLTLAAPGCAAPVPTTTILASPPFHIPQTAIASSFLRSVPRAPLPHRRNRDASTTEPMQCQPPEGGPPSPPPPRWPVRSASRGAYGSRNFASPNFSRRVAVASLPDTA
jgi:hypothetical protein